MKFSIITRCTRLGNIETVKKSVFNNLPKNTTVEWHVVFDTAALKDIDAELLNKLDEKGTTLHFMKGDGWGLSQLNSLIKNLDGWVYHVDDDNIVHPDFYSTIENEYKNNKDAKAFIFSQYVGGNDFSKLEIREAIPENVAISKIDLAQWLIHSSLHANYEYGSGYVADGTFITNLYNNEKDKFVFIKDILCHYNYLEKRSTAKVPTILYIGLDEPELKSLKILDYEADNLNVKYLKSDENIQGYLCDIKPDCIVTRGDTWEEFPILASMPLQFRRKWINISQAESIENVGQYAYQCAMAIMLDPNSLEDSEMISYTTPIYNTREKLYDTYQSLLNQTYSNWEWVLVNDSTDGGRTLKIAEDIAAHDPRVKVYDFREKSGGNIGEVKWRANCMAKGFILAELDHDDLLVPWCTIDLYRAAKKHPEAGFFFNDTLEVNENWECQTYPEGFAFAYGSYRDEEYNGKMMKVANQHNINPKTIRHIVGVPNHVRAWRRSTYFEIGGHNRTLAIADDYELIVRTFLKTITCKIPKLGYVQFLYNNATGQNTHDLARADIQRRVRTIGYHYNEQIKDRFEALGLKDWAYDENPNAPLNSIPRYGDAEMAANIIYNENE
jgi:glycosyltransferase involved in cell wall biosynthesis